MVPIPVQLKALPTTGAREDSELCVVCLCVGDILLCQWELSVAQLTVVDPKQVDNLLVPLAG